MCSTPPPTLTNLATACAGLLLEHRGSLLTTAVIAETAWLGGSARPAEAAFLTMVVSNVDVVELTSRDYRRCIELIGTYSDLGLSLVDASIIAVASAHHHDGRRSTIATSAVRPVHCDALDLVP